MNIMKKYLFALILVQLVCTSCEDDLNVEPDFISEDSVFEDEALTEAYLANLYRAAPFWDLGGNSQTDMGLYSAVGAESINFANWQTANQAFLRTYSQQTGAGPLFYWPYAAIREANYLIENIGDSQSLSDSYIENKVQETRFLRAFMYFELVKRYGGVPLITNVQNENDADEELYPSRNTEKELYDFIYSELQDIVSSLPDDRTGAQGRVDKWTALALQSRAMLYAASVSDFGDVALNGLVGIPSSDAETYYQRSYEASELLMESGYFSLYDAVDNKVDNFSNLFLTEGFDNPEIIFAEVFEEDIKGHNLDYLAHPDGFNTVWNSNFPVLYDFVEEFEWIDQRDPVSRDELTASNSWDIDDFFGARDPRFVASVFYPQTQWRGEEVYFHINTTYTDPDTGQSVTTNTGFIDVDGDLWRAAGPPRNVRNTALLLRKRLDPNKPLNDVIPEKSGQDYFVFRFGEILLNAAEAAYYLGKEDESLELVNQIRDRAGMPLRSMITEDFIRHERQVELAFENHRFWDLIRWRIAVDVLDGQRMQGLVFRYNLDTDKYVITLKNAETQIRSFGPERYYLPFNQFILSENQNIVQNPGY